MPRDGTLPVSGRWWLAFVYLRQQSMTYSVKLNGPQLPASES